MHSMLAPSAPVMRGCGVPARAQRSAWLLQQHPSRRPAAACLAAASQHQHAAAGAAAAIAAIAPGAPLQLPTAKPQRSQSDLHDPAHIGACGEASCSVPDLGGDVSLDTYMRLPIEQYFVLDPKRITFLEGSRFVLSVPRVQLLGTWMEPQVEVTVTQEEGAVVLKAEQCRIRGCATIERMRLDERFALTFTTQLTWQTSAPGADAASGSTSSAVTSSSPAAEGQGQPAAAARQPQQTRLGGLSLGRLGLRHSAAAPQPPAGQLQASAQVDVWCEVVQPFHLLPRAALESSCNVVMRGLVNSLLPLFVKQLAADYQRWGNDEAYRASRSARSKPLAAQPSPAPAAARP